MRKSAALVLIALCASCGGGAEKAAFARYEQAVNPSLEAEAEVQARFAEKYDDMRAYLDDSGFDDVVLKKMTPLYAAMDAKMAAVTPEGEKLAELHGILRRYVAGWRGFCADWTRVIQKKKELARAGEAVLPAVTEAEAEWKKAGSALNSAVASAPAAMGALAPAFEAENAVSQRLLGMVQAIRSGKQSAKGAVGLIDFKYAEHYEAFKQAAGSPGLPVEVQLAMKAYVAGGQKMLAAVRAFALACVPVEEELADLVQSASGGMVETQALLKEYRNGAKAYRDSLR